MVPWKILQRSTGQASTKNVPYSPPASAQRFVQSASAGSRLGFSLNGVYRNQGSVGGSFLGRHMYTCTYKGEHPVGYGGYANSSFCRRTGECGSSAPADVPYPGIAQAPCSGSLASNLDVIQRTVMNTAGLIAATVSHPTSVYNPGCTTSCPRQKVKDEWMLPTCTLPSRKTKDHSVSLSGQVDRVLGCQTNQCPGGGTAAGSSYVGRAPTGRPCCFPSSDKQCKISTAVSSSERTRMLAALAGGGAECK